MSRCLLKQNNITMDGSTIIVEEQAKTHISTVDSLLEGVPEKEHVEVLREKLLETLTTLANSNQQRETQNEMQIERNNLFVTEIEKLQQFAMEGMTKVR